PADERPADGHDGSRKPTLLGVRALLHGLPLDRLRDAVAADDQQGRRLVRRPDQALPDADVRARCDRDRVATAVRAGLRGEPGAAGPRGQVADRARAPAQPADRLADGARLAPADPPALRPP